MTNPTVRPATSNDVHDLGVIGPAAYAEAYAYLWPDPAAYARRLATLGATAFAELLARLDARVWVAEVGGRIVGFLTMALGVADPVERCPGGAEVGRIYLLGPARGLGLGRALIDAAAAEAAREGASHLWLDAMVSADWARRTYARWGFREIGRTRFDQGVREELSGMVVMRMDLG